MRDGPVVVGVDGSEGSRAALKVAAEEARAHGRVLRAVMVYGYLEQHHRDGIHGFDPGYSEDDAKEALGQILEQELGAKPAVPVEPVLTVDLAARALIEQSEGAAMIVVGARGLGGFKGLLLGSVSQQVVHHARCPVLVVRQPEP